MLARGPRSPRASAGGTCCRPRALAQRHSLSGEGRIAARSIFRPMGVAAKIGKSGLQAARRLRILRWVVTTRLRMAWSGMKLELEFGPDVVLYVPPRLRLSTRGRGGSLRIVFGRDVR